MNQTKQKSAPYLYGKRMLIGTDGTAFDRERYRVMVIEGQAMIVGDCAEWDNEGRIIGSRIKPVAMFSHEL